MRKALLASLFYFVLSTAAIAQVGKLVPYVDHQFAEQSLNSVTQDDQGFLWVSSPERIFRFDGIHFEQALSLPQTISKLNETILGISNYSDHQLFVQTQHYIYLVHLLTQLRRTIDLRDSSLSDASLDCIHLQKLGPGDLLLHCLKEHYTLPSLPGEDLVASDR
ncbi:MAG: hypothetical protein AAF985_16000, partial [Bacteroidota bacterium]